MIRLFNEDARTDTNTKEFTTLGIGVLSDAISCKITNELNGQYELEMEYPVTGSLYNEIELNRIVVTKVDLYTEHEQGFRIYYISVPIDGKVTINARHISYDLSNLNTKPFEAKDPKEVMEDKIQNGLSYLGEDIATMFSFTTDYERPVEEESDDEEDEEEKPYLKVNTPSSVRSVLGGEGGLLDTFGGELEFDNFEVIHHCKDKPIGKDRGFEVRYGSNMVDMEQKREVKNDYSAIYPYYCKKETESDSETLSTYKTVYIAKKMTKNRIKTRTWLSFEKDGEPFDPEKELGVSTTSPISSAIQIKSSGEYKDKLFIYISDTFLNNMNGSSNSVIDMGLRALNQVIRVFNFIPITLTSADYAPSAYYYTTDVITEEHPIEKCTFLLDTADEMTEGRQYYNAVVKGTTDVLAGHYYPIPKYAYVSRCGDLAKPTTGTELDIDDNILNNERWLSYTPGGEPISTSQPSAVMRMIPMQVQDGLAQGKLVMWTSLTNTGKYKELKSGIEKAFPETETNTSEKVTIIELEKYNETTMDSEKLVEKGVPYYYSTVDYTFINLTPSEYEANKYYYQSDNPRYIPATLTSNQYQSGTYYVLVSGSQTEYELDPDDHFVNGRIYYDRVVDYVLDTSDEITTGRDYYEAKYLYSCIYFRIDTFIYEPNKYYYVEDDSLPQDKWKFIIDESQTATPDRQYFEVMVCEKAIPPIHEMKYEANKYYKRVSAGGDEVTFVLATEAWWSANVDYYLRNEGEDQYRSDVTYYTKCPDAPLVFINPDEEKDYRKVLSVDLSSYFEEVPNGELLAERAQKYLEDNKEIFETRTDESVTTSFIRLSDSLEYEFLGNMEEIQNGDIVKVVNTSSNVETRLKVTQIEFDAITNTYSCIELGAKAEDLSDTVLTNGADISSLTNNKGYVGRAEVKHLIAETLDAENINVTGMLNAMEGDIKKLIVNTLQVTDLNADNIVTGTLGAETVKVTSAIEVYGYSKSNIDTLEEYEDFYDGWNSGTDLPLFYKESEYGSYKADTYEFTYQRIGMDADTYEPNKYYYIEDNLYVLDEGETMTPDRQYYEYISSFVYGRIYYIRGSNVFSVNNEGHLISNSAYIKGEIEADSGYIGDCRIQNGHLEVNSANITELNADKIKGGTISASDIKLGKFYEAIVLTSYNYYPNTYYYKVDDEYVLDTADEITEGRQYYTLLHNFVVDTYGNTTIRNGSIFINKGSIKIGRIYDKTTGQPTGDYRFDITEDGTAKNIKATYLSIKSVDVGVTDNSTRVTSTTSSTFKVKDVYLKEFHVATLDTDAYAVVTCRISNTDFNNKIGVEGNCKIDFGFVTVQFKQAVTGLWSDRHILFFGGDWAEDHIEGLNYDLSTGDAFIDVTYTFTDGKRYEDVIIATGEFFDLNLVSTTPSPVEYSYISDSKLKTLDILNAYDNTKLCGIRVSDLILNGHEYGKNENRYPIIYEGSGQQYCIKTGIADLYYTRTGPTAPGRNTVYLGVSSDIPDIVSIQVTKIAGWNGAYNETPSINGDSGSNDVLAGWYVESGEKYLTLWNMTDQAFQVSYTVIYRK